MEPLDPIALIQPRRKIHGVSAVLLPFKEASDSVGEIDWQAFERLLTRTVDAGLTPAVNMDTGYANLLDAPTRADILKRTRELLAAKPFMAGSYVSDQPGSGFAADDYAREIETIQSVGAVPVIFQSYGLAHQSDDAIVASYQKIADWCDSFVAFELGQMFAPFGKIYSLDVYSQLMDIDRCIGAKHSSLCRELEWRRLLLRNERRPEFRVFTGNDLAIDMVIYGSDYLLGLSAFAPDAFAERDRLWEAGDAAWNEWNDLLQHLGFLAFRDPVPAYKHSAAVFLKERGWIDSDATPAGAGRRGQADRELLGQLARQVEDKLAAASTTANRS